MIEIIRGYIKKLTLKIKRMRVQKMHIDYVAGLLTIPVLLTAVLVNFGNLNKNEKAPTTTTPSPQVIIVTTAPNSNANTPNAQTSQTTPTPICMKSVGPVSITSPTEGQAVSDNPVCIQIDYSDSSYCSVVWSYRINGGSWSDFNNNSPCLYNLSNGNVQFQLRVNSTVSSDSTTLTRNFVYNGANNPVSTPTPTNTPTPTPTNTPTPTATPTLAATPTVVAPTKAQ